MDRLVNFLTSRQLMGALFILLSMVLAVATFLENDFGYNAAHAMVYNTWWFELIFLLLAINMFGNLFAFHMWRWSKAPVLLFHLSFFIILVGAAITRYIGYEGTMPIREGETSNTIYTTQSYLSVDIHDDEGQQTFHEPVFLSPATPHEYSGKVEINGTTFRLQSEEFTPNAAMRPVRTEEGNPLAGILVASGEGRQEHFLSPGERLTAGGLTFQFGESEFDEPDVLVRMEDDESLSVTSPHSMELASMDSNGEESLEPGQETAFTRGKVLSVKGTRIALSRFWPDAEYRPASMPQQQGSSLPNIVTVDVSGEDGVNHKLYASGREGEVGEEEILTLNGGELRVRYGSLPLDLPFSIRLNDFQLERYPGSESPSSYASEVTLIDPENDVEMDYRIFMNNILNYGGYRFYQSSYDKDEKGTILSVNHDFWGTLITYIGYFLLTVGMFWSLAAPNTRFRQLIRKTGKIYQKRKGLTTLLFFLLTIPVTAQEMPPKPDKEVASALGELWVQDKGGRIKPLNTTHQEVMIKLVKHNSFKGFSPDQMLLGMFTHPSEWQEVPLITVDDPRIKEMLGISRDKAAFVDFFDNSRNYKLQNQVDAAYRKDPADRNKTEQELVKVDEQLNVFYTAQRGEMHRIFPVNNDEDKPWLTPAGTPEGLSDEDSLFVSSALTSFIGAVREGNHDKALQVVDDISGYQEDHGGELLPSDTRLRAELLYNRLNIFMWLATFFFVLGIILVIYNIAGLVKPGLLKNRILKATGLLIVAGFLYHTFGLGLRWYVSGHAPWSNGYESMIFIAWALLLAGLVFSRRSPFVLSVTALFAGVVLMVSHLSWMNPEITNLVPVLKSYWLTLHVAVIIGGYGFMMLGALLGFMNLLLTSLQNVKNRARLSLTIDELTAINEMALIAGLYLMTIGSFLGGVWANESWGRYWGWDPKETWSLITILIYAFVVHMRLIPGLRGKMAFNTASLLAFASVIMTYLGVNYYLSGMHSYAGGDPVPVPDAVYYVVVIAAVLIGYAYYKESRLRRATAKPGKNEGG
ncbi:MAG: c-type cytochrome biogenesis protein CcsB [Bacteroidota bacterium]